MDWKEIYKSKLTTADEAVKHVRNDDIVYVGGGPTIPLALCEALGRRENELRNVRISCSQIIQPMRLTDPVDQKAFRTISYFLGPGERGMQAADLNDYTSTHVSNIDLFLHKVAPVTVAMLDVSLPDENGNFSFGACGSALAFHACEVADRILVQVNRNQPYMEGEGNVINVADVTAIVEKDDPIMENPNLPVDETVKTLSDFIVEQIPDGATIQLGLGGLAVAVGFGLRNKTDLGIHSEMVGDSIMELMKNGNVTNKKKTFMPNISLAGFAFGTEELYRFVDHNKDFCFMPFTMVNNPVNIAKNDNMISVNTALGADIFGQINAENLGGIQFSGIGGQVDYVRGAQMSKGGKSFIALTSTYTDRKGKVHSRIYSSFPPFTQVTTSRADVQYVATEYGCVNLKLLTMRERIKAMISLAHPMFRERLTDEAKEAKLI